MVSNLLLFDRDRFESDEKQKVALGLRADALAPSVAGGVRWRLSVSSNHPAPRPSGDRRHQRSVGRLARSAEAGNTGYSIDCRDCGWSPTSILALLAGRLPCCRSVALERAPPPTSRRLHTCQVNALGPRRAGQRSTPPRALWFGAMAGKSHARYDGSPAAGRVPTLRRSAPSTAGGVHNGWVAEWFKAPVLKTGVGSRSPGVRIPPHPP